MPCAGVNRKQPDDLGRFAVQNHASVLDQGKMNPFGVSSVPIEQERELLLGWPVAAQCPRILGPDQPDQEIHTGDGGEPEGEFSRWPGFAKLESLPASDSDPVYDLGGDVAVFHYVVPPVFEFCRDEKRIPFLKISNRPVFLVFPRFNFLTVLLNES